MKAPCDEAVIRSTASESRCAENAQVWILAATILGSSMAFIDSTVVNVALPAIQNSFHATVVDVQWVVESYGLLLGSLILLGGSLGDLFGRRLVFLLGVVLFAAASLGCGMASNIHFLNFARSVQGVGAALLVPGSLAIISASFDQQSRGKAIGTWSGFTAITTAIGPVAGGWLVQHASWRWAFFVNLPLAAAVIAISLWRIPESRSTTTSHLDWWGTIFCALGLGGLVNGFVESGNLGWRNPLVFGSIIIGCLCIVAFARVESRSSSPMVPLALFKSRSFSGANLLTLFLYAAVGIFFFLFPLNLIQVHGYSPTATGAAVLPMILLMFSLSRWAGGLVQRYGPSIPLIIGPLIAASGFLLFALPSVGGKYWTTFFPAIVVLGLGMTITVAPLTTVVMSSADEDHAGTASGINNAVARVAGVLAIAVLGIVMLQAFSTRLNHRLAELSLPADVVHQIQADEIKLAGLQVSSNLEPSFRSAIKRSVAGAFVFGFRIVMLVCAVLAAAGALVARIMIVGNKKVATDSAEN
ncbi:MAG: MFS transporter [Acidobacteriota bacterium]|nr:MFS transporter [Acidobacteriota bacterium]